MGNVDRLDDKLDVTSFPGFEQLHPELQEGLRRLEFTCGHEQLVRKLISVGGLTTRYLDLAEQELRSLTSDEVDEIYELQNILFNNQDLQDLAAPLFGSPNIGPDGEIDKKSWFWNLINPLGGVPHLGQANRLAGTCISSHFEALGGTEKTIVEAGFGGGKTALAILGELDATTVSQVSYQGYEVAPELVGHAILMFKQEVPDYIEGDDQRFQAYKNQANTFRGLREVNITRGSIADHMTNLDPNSVDAMMFGYIIHHLKCGEAFIRAVLAKRIRIQNEQPYYVPTYGDRIELDKQTFDTNLLRFVNDDQGQYQRLLRVLSSEERIQAEELRGRIRNNQLELLKAARAKLKPGAKIIIADPERGVSNYNRDVLIKDAEGLADFTSAKQMAGFLKEAGYNNIKVFLQWEIEKDYYEAHKEEFSGLDIVEKSFDGGKTVLGYIVALPLEQESSFKASHQAGIVDEHLGYLVVADNRNKSVEVAREVRDGVATTV